MRGLSGFRGLGLRALDVLGVGVQDARSLFLVGCVGFCSCCLFFLECFF